MFGALVSIPQLSHSFASVSLVEGQDMNLFNKVLPKYQISGYIIINSVILIVSYNMWMYEFSYLSTSTELMLFPLQDEIPKDTMRSKVKVVANNDCVVQGLMLWMDWLLIPNSDLILSTSPKFVNGEITSTPDRQAILHFSEIKLSKGEFITFEIEFNTSNGELSIIQLQ